MLDVGCRTPWLITFYAGNRTVCWGWMLLHSIEIHILDVIR